MRHHLGILALFFLLLTAFCLAWRVIDGSQPGYRTPVQCGCKCDQAEADESADDDTPELL